MYRVEVKVLEVENNEVNLIKLSNIDLLPQLQLGVGSEFPVTLSEDKEKK